MKIKLNGMKKSFVIAALVVPQIYSTITNQMVARVPQNYPHLKNARLADSFPEQLMSIDRLIVTNFCHAFFTDEIKRGKSNEPFALISHIGWVLSENYKVNEKQKSKNAHTFFVGNETFWKYEPFNDNSLEMIYPNDMKETSDEDNVYEFYKRNLSFKGKCYEVNLHLETNYVSLPDTYSMVKSRIVNCGNS